MKIEDRGLIYDSRGHSPSDRVAFQTGLYPARSGAIFATCQVGPKKHAATARLQLCRSRDSGRTWHELPWRFETTLDGVAGSLLAGELIESQPGTLLLMASWWDRSDPDRPILDPTTKGILHTRNLISSSTDDGETWRPWRDLAIPGLRGNATTGPALGWPDGTIGYAFESTNEYDEAGPPRHSAQMILSHDGGRTFGQPIVTARDPEQQIYFWDQRNCLAPNGDIVGMYWTHDLKTEVDLPVHLRRFSLAKDDFQSAPIRATTIPGQISAPLCLPDGRLLAFTVNRAPPGTMTLRCSRDDGRSWDDELVVYTHDARAQAADGKQKTEYVQYWDDMLKWCFGHPAIRSLGDGKVLLAWYAGTPDALSLHSARVEVGR